MKKTNVSFVNQGIKTERPPAPKQYPLNFDYRNPVIKIESQKTIPETKSRNERPPQSMANINVNTSLKSNSDSSFEVKRSFQAISINKSHDSFTKNQKPM